MANEQHLEILKQRLKVWNEWREKNPKIEIDLTGADLAGEDLEGMDLTGVYLDRANLSLANLNGSKLIGAKLLKANLEDSDLNDGNLTGVDLKDAKLIGAKLQRTILTGAKLIKADFTGADLTEATLDGVNLYQADLTRGNLQGANLSDSDLTGVNLTRADLIKATLTGVNLTGANLNGTNFYRANLTGADLSRANLDNASFYEANLTEANLTKAHIIETNFEKANLSGCRIYGISAWRLKLDGAKQFNLVITPPEEPVITVDNLEVAQFIYLLLRNEKIRQVINTITSKVVLILGRFTPERKAVLYALREELRKRNYLPVLFDFEKPSSKTFIETVSTLAHMARFVIADFTDPKIVLQEVQHIVPNIAVPVIPLLLEGSEEPITLYDLRINHRSLLNTYWYKDSNHLLATFGDIIKPVEAKVEELEKKRKELEEWMIKR